MDSIEKQLSSILEEYGSKVETTVKRVTEEIATETVSELQSRSPKAPGGGEYARSWDKKPTAKGMVVYNKGHYMLTHLLEFGHVSANQYGVYSKRVAARTHVKPVETEMIQKYINQIRKEIE